MPAAFAGQRGLKGSTGRGLAHPRAFSVAFGRRRGASPADKKRPDPSTLRGVGITI